MLNCERNKDDKKEQRQRDSISSLRAGIEATQLAVSQFGAVNLQEGPKTFYKRVLSGF